MENDYLWIHIIKRYTFFIDYYYYYIYKNKKEGILFRLFPALPISKMPKNRSIFVFKAFFYF